MKTKHAAAGVALAVLLLAIGSTPAMADNSHRNTVATHFPATLLSKPAYRLGEPITLTFGLRNATGQDYSVLVWNTPLEDLNQEVLDYVKVRHGDRVLPYDGRLIKRGEPNSSSYRLIRSGESVQKQIDLSTSFAITEPGTYTVTLNTHLHDAIARVGTAPSTRARAQFTRVALDQATVTFQVLPGGQPRSPTADALPRNTSVPTNITRSPKDVVLPDFIGGTADQQDETTQAHLDGYTYTEDSISALPESSDSASDRYTTWFGSYDATRYTTVRDHYSKIAKQLESSPITYNLEPPACGTSDTFAYVYPDKPETVYLCSAFWNAQPTGTDSKAGTVVHELSHFTINGGTEDNAYGQGPCQELAASDPDTAIQNADSHEYFAENNPQLSRYTLNLNSTTSPSAIT